MVVSSIRHSVSRNIIHTIIHVDGDALVRNEALY